MTERPGRKRRLRLSLLGVVTATAVMVLLDVAQAYSIAASLALRSVPRYRLGAGVLDRQVPGASVVYLLVGSDLRDGMPRTIPALGRLTGRRADSVMLVRADRRSGVRLVALPRDTRVVVPGHGDTKLGGAIEFGVPSLIAAVKQVTGLPVHHYVEVNFEGFADLVDLLGGVDIRLRAPLRDVAVRLSLPSGVAHLDGTMALQLVRARHVEEFRAGRWTPASSGDVGRIMRQHQLLAALLSRAADANPVGLFTMARALGAGTQVDDRLTGPDLVAAARTLDHSSSSPGSEQPSARFCIWPTRFQLDGDIATSPFPPAHDGSAVFRVVDRSAAEAVRAWFSAPAGSPRDAAGCPGNDGRA